MQGLEKAIYISGMSVPDALREQLCSQSHRGSCAKYRNHYHLPVFTECSFASPVVYKVGCCHYRLSTGQPDAGACLENGQCMCLS